MHSIPAVEREPEWDLNSFFFINHGKDGLGLNSHRL